jgi:muramidase (phage lysozyme)
MAKFAPQIEMLMPSGDVLLMTEEELDTIRTGKIDLGAVFAAAPKDKTNYLREEDIQAFLDWTTVTQDKENRPIGANTAQGQAKIDSVIGVTDTNLPPEARSFLNAIAEAEGGTYTNRFGGGQIPDPNQHPETKVKAYGTESSASGRYQILTKTWKGLQEQYPDLVDFSPINQDRAAWRLAQDVYKTKTNGGDLLSDLKAGKTDVIRENLKDTWSALRKKPLRYEMPSADAQTPPVGSSKVEYDVQGKIRSQKLSPTLETKIGDAVGQVFGPGFKARIYSGGQESNTKGEGTGSVRHNDGMAGDVYVVGPDGNVVQDTTQLDKLKNFWLQNNMGSVGTYMQGGGLHLDEWTQDKLLPGMGLTWSYGNG